MKNGLYLLVGVVVLLMGIATCSEKSKQADTIKWQPEPTYVPGQTRTLSCDHNLQNCYEK